MTVYGVSPSTWVERVVNIQGSHAGVLLIVSDLQGNVELERIVVPPEELLAAILEPAEGGSTIQGTSPAHNAIRLLAMQVKGNEVLLNVRGGPAVCDVAVGLDDIQDALEKAMAPE
jgi:hypothetical protein